MPKKTPFFQLQTSNLIASQIWKRNLYLHIHKNCNKIIIVKEMDHLLLPYTFLWQGHVKISAFSFLAVVTSWIVLKSFICWRYYSTSKQMLIAHLSNVSKNVFNVIAIFAFSGGSTQFGLDGGVSLELWNSYPFLRVILAEKDIHT